MRETTEDVIFDVTTSKLEETTSPLCNLYQRATALKPLEGIINSLPVSTQCIKGWVYVSMVESFSLRGPRGEERQESSAPIADTGSIRKGKWRPSSAPVPHISSGGRCVLTVNQEASEHRLTVCRFYIALAEQT